MLLVTVLKGIVQAKMKILSLISHSHVMSVQTRKIFIHLRNTNQMKVFLINPESFLSLCSSNASKSS